MRFFRRGGSASPTNFSLVSEKLCVQGTNREVKIRGRIHWRGEVQMRSLLRVKGLFWVLVITVLTSCGGSGGGSGEGDSIPPMVPSSSLVPPDGATGVAINSMIAVAFDEPMDGSTINTDTFIVSFNPIVEGTVTYVAETKTAIFTPSSDLEPDTIHTITITTGVADLAGNTLEEDLAWTFTTGTVADHQAPTVQSTNPANDETDVMVNSVITAVFSEAMAPSSINTTTFLLEDDNEVSVSGTVNYIGVTAMFTPSSNLDFDTTYTATITTSASDISENVLVEDYVWSFTTGMLTDTQPPTITGNSPTDGATSVAVSTNVTATFSEAMDPSSINTDTFTLSTNPPVGGTVSYDAQTLTVTFNPSSDLDPNTTYTATVTAGSEDLAGNPLQQDEVWTFTTASQMMGDTTPPTIQSTNPTDDATDVALNPSVTVTFSESMAPSTITTSTFLLEDDTQTMVTGSVSLNGSVATFTPDSVLQMNTPYTAKVTTGIEDLAGNALEQDHEWSFTTGSTVNVSIIGPASACENAYSPSIITVEVGTTVVWTNNTSSTHTVTSSNGTLGTLDQCVGGGSMAASKELDSPNIQSGGTYPHTFHSPGEFVYDCVIAGHRMRGAVVVE